MNVNFWPCKQIQRIQRQSPIGCLGCTWTQTRSTSSPDVRLCGWSQGCSAWDAADWRMSAASNPALYKRWPPIVQQRHLILMNIRGPPDCDKECLGYWDLFRWIGKSVIKVFTYNMFIVGLILNFILIKV